MRGSSGIGLPMTLVFMSIVSAMIAERIQVRPALILIAVPLTDVGIASVFASGMRAELSRRRAILRILCRGRRRIPLLCSWSPSSSLHATVEDPISRSSLASTRSRRLSNSSTNRFFTARTRCQRPHFEHLAAAAAGYWHLADAAVSGEHSAKLRRSQAIDTRLELRRMELCQRP